MPDELLSRLRRFNTDYFPQYQSQFKDLVEQGQHPTTLFIGCSDSRLVPHLLTGAGPGELFLVRNVGAFVPPYDGMLAGARALDGGAPLREGPRAPEGNRHWVGLHGTAAAIEYAVLALNVQHIIVCGHSHCGGVRALYGEVPDEAPNLKAWLALGREAALPVQVSEEALRRTEERSVVLQLERLMDYPMVRARVERGQISLHGWHYVIEAGEVHVFDVNLGHFVPASSAEHSGTGPYREHAEEDSPLFNEIDAAWAPRSGS
ncbi:carbonic anhydrase [Roseateles koreensis]|uniref:Carbonic anhydrase n=1 Tax=Roseateles koreensis TaxID=2987526 RepID=A0ABT5KT04_9BURK|nr:carbonic anhydrase [Roseateles koreensis]MDC8786071.1 carbonic anhydrase [Roseateles koreensis]